MIIYTQQTICKSNHDVHSRQNWYSWKPLFRFQGTVSIIHFYTRTKPLTKFPTFPSREHNILPPLFHLDLLTSDTLFCKCKAFIVVLVPSQSASISKLNTIIWSGSVHLGRDATILDPVSSFVVNFYWAVETTDGTHQSVCNQLYRPKSNLAAQTPHCLLKFCWKGQEQNFELAAKIKYLV